MKPTNRQHILAICEHVIRRAKNMSYHVVHACQRATRQRKNKPEILGTATVACLRIWWPVRTEGAAATPFPHWAKEMAKIPHRLEKQTHKVGDRLGRERK